jgi:hypothetical protein
MCQGTEFQYPRRSANTTNCGNRALSERLASRARRALKGDAEHRSIIKNEFEDTPHLRFNASVLECAN